MDKTITEDYVSYETSLLLKEKGFDSDCNAVYDLERPKSCADGKLYFNFDNKNPNRFQDLCAAPTLHMTMKWLRKVHHKYCDIRYDIDLYWFFHIIELKELKEYFDYSELKYYHTENETGFNSYEEACEAAIKYCLMNLIK